MNWCAAAVLRALLVAHLALTAGIAIAEPMYPPLPGDSTGVPLGPYAEVLVDRDGKLTLDEVRSSAAFTRNVDDVPNLGYSSATLWLRFRLPREAHSSDQLLLEIRWPTLDRIEFYAPKTEAGKEASYARKVVGDTLPWHAREINDRNFVFRLAPDSADLKSHYYLRVQSQGALVVPGYLWRPQAFASHSRASLLGFGIFYGLALALILYNLMLLVSVRDTAYLFYVLYAVAFAVWLLGFDGFTHEYVGPATAWWPNNGTAAFLALTLVCGAQFARSFLGTKDFAPILDRLLLACAAASAVLALGVAIGWISYRAHITTASALAIPLALLIIVAATRALLRGYRVARFFLLAWSVLLAAMVVAPLRNFGLLPYSVTTLYSLHVGFAIDLVLFSLALGDRINFLNLERSRIRKIFGRYVSDAVVAKLLADDRPPNVQGELLTVTVLFSDIRGFTALSERLSAPEVVEMLNAYFTRVCEPILAQEGTVDKYIGDGVMAVFGSPVSYPDHARRALRAALGMAREADNFKKWMSARFAGRGLGEFAAGIGLVTGEAVIGDIGTPKRREFTAIGDTVNAASRLEGITKDLNYVIVAAESTVKSAGIGVRTGRSRTVTVKGRVEEIRVYEILGLEETG